MSTKKILNISVIALLVLVNLPVYSYGGDTFNPVVITTEPLTVIGKGTPAPPDTPPAGKGAALQQTNSKPTKMFIPVTINTGELSATGKGTPGTAPVPTQKMLPTKSSSKPTLK